jgi:surface-anchored protein
MKLNLFKTLFAAATSRVGVYRCQPRSGLLALVLAVLGLAQPQNIAAADGPAPVSQARRVVSGVHADAISVFAENGGLTLATKADVDGNLGVRLDPNLTLFNVEESTRTTVPAAPSYDFLGVAGSDVWLAPETNPGGTALWPGFSTEGVPSGLVDGNQLTLRLESVTGPGTLHVFQTSAFGDPIRRFSSTGTVHQAWTVANGTHAHADWAFSAAGTYTLTFSATALTNGVSISTTQSYAFVVGNVPTAVATTTTLTASTNRIVQGNSVTLDATVTPNTAVGWVEFLDGATVLGHDAVTTGAAALSTTNLALGSRSVTARFVPQWLNDLAASTSAPVVITNTTPSGVPFGITGVASSYLPGESLNAQIVGATLQPGQIAYGPSPAVTLTVGNAPTISDIANQFVTENTTSGAIAFTVGDVETAAGDLVVTATSSATNIVPNANLVLGGSGANRTLTITPAVNRVGSTMITVTVTDAGGLQSSDSFVLTIVGNHVVPFALPAYYGGEVSTSVGSSAAADLNGDGKVDLVYGAASQNTLRWAPGTGDGGFLPERGLGVGLNLGANAVTAVDYDGDGDIDVLTVELDAATQAGTASDGMVSLYRNDGTGQFTRSVLVATGLKQAPRLAVGDLNNDGRPDIVYGSTRPGSPLQQQDTFYALQLPSGDVGTPTKLADYLMELQIADVNGDGNADIVGGRFRTDFAYSIHFGDGTGNFATPQIITTGGAVGVFAVNDVTGDGRPDIVSTDTASGQRSLALYRQNADGTFAARVALPQNFTTAGTPPIRVADINQDGIPDLVTYGATGSVTAAFWLPGLGGGTFGPPVYLFPGAGGAAPVSRGLHVLDLDGDTYPDIVAVGPTSSSVPKPIAVFLNKTGEDPRVVSPPAARTRLAGELIEFKIYFGFPIAVTGTPRIALDLNGSTIYANYLSGTGTPTLTFRYTVGSNDLDLDGVQLAGTTIDLNGGTMTNPAGGAAALSFPATPFTGVFVNAFGPLVQSVTRLDQRTTTAGTVRFSVQFSESVTNVDAADFVVRANDGDLAGATVQAVAGSGSLYEVTVSTGTGSGVLGLTVQGSSINGVSGASFSKTYVGGEVYTVRPQPIGTINTYYTHGHADYRPIYDNGEFDFVLHASPGVLPQTEYTSEQVVTYLDSTSIVNRGADASFDFLGVAAGEPLYLSNASGSIATVPYLGFSAESLRNVFTSSLTMQLVGVRSSSGGQFSLYSVGGLGEVTVRMATSDGITAADVLSLPVGAHGHFNTAFSKAGTYEVDIVASGYLDGNANGTYDAGVDQYVESGIQTLVFHVDTLGARNDSFSVVEGSMLNGNVSMNDPWHAGIGAFTASVVTNTAHGTLTFNTDGSFSYVPNVGFFGTDSFVYRVTNKRGGYTTATASIAVTDLALTVANGTATLTIATENGKTYQLETALKVTGPWADVGVPINGTGQIVPVVVPIGGPSGFFRWRTIQNH